MDRKKIRNKAIRIVLAFAAVFTASYVVYLILGLAPFGNLSFTHRDGDIQMLDFLRCFKRFLEGDGSMLYSFSKGLGDNMYPLFTYYLASPVNLFVVFFRYEDLPAFVDFAVALKLALSGAAFIFFIENRYEITGARQVIVSEVLAVCYAFCSFGITAGCFLPFLEGMVFLPLMAAGVYKAVEGKNRTILIASAALAVICNWYMGAICCLYSVVLLAIELFRVKRTAKEILRALLRYTYCMEMGLLLSVVVLFPTLMALGSHGGTDMSGLFTPEIYGNPLSFFTNYKPLSISDMANPAVFAGSFVLIVSIAFFVSRKALRQKITFALALLFTIAIFYFRPLVNLYLLLRENTAFAYGYRYAFAASFLLCFIAAEALIGGERTDVKPLPIAVTGGLFAVMILISDIVDGNTSVTAFSVGLVVLITVFLSLMQSNIRYDLRRVMAGFVIALCAAEVALHVIVMLPLYCTANVESYRNYSVDQARLKDSLPKDGIYRVTQNGFRDENLFKGLTCCYNDSLAYGYYGLTSYSSAQSDRAGIFMDRAGYHYSAGTMNIVNTPNLATDSFLGVKYVASRYDIPGLVKTHDEQYNSMRIYENPSALDLAFTIPFSADKTSLPRTNDFFEFNNWLWSLIADEEIRIFEPVTFEAKEDEDSVRYEIDTSKEDSLYYGYVGFNSPREMVIDVNGAYETAYFNWLAPSVFQIPTDKENSYVDVPDKDGDPYFERLDLKELERASEIVKSKSGKVDITKFCDGHISLTAEVQEPQYLCITVPYDEQWEVKVNGKTIEPDLLADTFFLIPLDQGVNTIEMNYHVMYLMPSLIISILSLILVVSIEVLLHTREKNKKKQ
ncbi:MAG: YfhO family protein [Clostridiales bacterium]|nr:YfhO family protein [Clostridiales bacterium]